MLSEKILTTIPFLVGVPLTEQFIPTKGQVV